MPRVTLCRLSEKDCDARWVRWLNDPAVSQWLASRGRIRWTLPRLRRWFRAHARRPGTRIYGIMAGRRRVGTLKIEGLGSERWASVGLMIGERRWRGHGIGTAAIREAVRIADNAYNIGVWAGMLTSNWPSRNAFRRVGFSLAAEMVATHTRIKGVSSWYAAGHPPSDMTVPPLTPGTVRMAIRLRKVVAPIELRPYYVPRATR